MSDAATILQGIELGLTISEMIIEAHRNERLNEDIKVIKGELYTIKRYLEKHIEREIGQEELEKFKKRVESELLLGFRSEEELERTIKNSIKTPIKMQESLIDSKYRLKPNTILPQFFDQTLGIGKSAEPIGEAEGYIEGTQGKEFYYVRTKSDSHL